MIKAVKVCNIIMAAKIAVVFREKAQEVNPLEWLADSVFLLLPKEVW